VKFAARVAENGPQVASIVDARAGILFDIIDGQTEAEVIYANHIEDRLDPEMVHVLYNRHRTRSGVTPA
jgi:hypothetical protein